MRTKSGKRVENLTYTPRNAVGDFVTFPIKGTIIERERPLKTRYQIWTLDGSANIMKESADDLVI